MLLYGLESLNTGNGPPVEMQANSTLTSAERILQTRARHVPVDGPFALVVIGVGKPGSVPPDLPLDEIESLRQNVQEAVMSLMRECGHVLQNS